MSEMHPDPLAETFRHASTNAQTGVTGVARIMEQRLARQERQRRFEAEQQRQAAEQARAEATTIRAAQAARERQMQETQQQQDIAVDAADRSGTEAASDLTAGAEAEQGSGNGPDQDGPAGDATVDQAVADAYPAGPAAAATGAARGASAAPTGAQAAQQTHGPGIGAGAGPAQPSVPEMG
jgi:hypothetical protein